MSQRFGVRFGLYYNDYDHEIAEELTPDPFSEEPHSLAHRGRYKADHKTKARPQEKKADQ